MTITNILLTIAILAAAIGIIFYYIKKKKEEPVQEEIDVDDKTYTLEKMQEFVKKRLDEITKVNLYDIGLSEEELKRRKNKKYELKKALKGCTYGDINDKKYVKELIYDLLEKEYGVNETNISKAIPFDIPSLLTPQDKFDILIYMYKKEFGYEALTEIIRKYDYYNGEFFYRKQVVYDFKNNKIEGMPESKNYLEYDKDGNIIKERVVGVNYGRMNRITKNTYDENGNCIKRSTNYKFFEDVETEYGYQLLSDYIRENGL